MNTRAAVAEVIAQVLRGKSLSALFPEYSHKVAAKELSLFKELCFGTLRWYPAIELLLQELMQKPLREKEYEVQGLLASGLYQLMHTRIADHAALNETVAAVIKLKRPWAKGLVNGVLRNFLRQRDELETKLGKNPIYVRAHPQWLLDKFFSHWGSEIALQIIDANNQRAPMTLRVNQRKQSRADYLAQLTAVDIAARATLFSPQGILLQSATDVAELPGFADGAVSVQDEAAQLAASLLELEPEQNVLDACCAPGGKTCHILEIQPELRQLVAIELEGRRTQRVEDNLQRLGLEAQLIVADAGKPETWWNKQLFQRILLDAPCSASGVIRRHPDIKLLRKPADIGKLAAVQLQLLRGLWQTLDTEGILLYATCSVLPDENDQVVEKFLAETPDAELYTIEADWGITTNCGRQLFPAVDGNDGFYYARLRKSRQKQADNKPEE
jgi:16S rRNA (cytosine967-C5)-methyltransferase